MNGQPVAVHLWSGLAATVLSAHSGGLTIEVGGARRRVPTFDVATVAEWERDRTEFDALATEWERSGRAAAHRSRLAIVLMDGRALPHAVARLRAGEERWVGPIADITGEDPISRASRGNPAAERRDWLRWLDDTGYN